ncbi:hypothetical protein HK405_011268 [Cladochytrium tenue]|nr:hypothetical protein HK405_011268 [Cladochytrium tenue]
MPSAPSSPSAYTGVEPAGQMPPLEWKVPNLAKFLIANRSVGSPFTINIMLTFSTLADLDADRLAERLTEVQHLWPLLSVEVFDQRTPSPKLRYRHASWPTERVLAFDTYAVNERDPKAERDEVFDKALRLFQTKVSFDQDPLWRVTVFRASYNPESRRVYLALTLDHAIIDGRGALKLAQALLAADISHLPKEDISLYVKVRESQKIDETPSILFVLGTIFREALVPRLPIFAQNWMGYVPAWPQKIPRPTIESPWRSSIVDIPVSVMKALKGVGKRHGVATLNPTLHTAWTVALWAVQILRKDGVDPRRVQFRDCSIKDLRDMAKGDPYCLAGHVAMFLWSSGAIPGDGATTKFWDLARSYSAVSLDPQAHADGFDLMRMLNLVSDGPVDPSKSAARAPASEELPAGDKRAHTLCEAQALDKINSLSPYGGMSGIWSNLAYSALPRGATDMVFGVSGSSTGPAFYTCVVGHEGGVRLQNTYSNGAAVTAEEMRRAEELCLNVLESVAREGEEDRDWSLAELLGPAPI